MSNLQYIGARYVPKFYTNSAVPSSYDWEAGVGYEPLTIVTYNDDTYTSKVPVPPEVGSPADNPDYWAKTGNYNAAMQGLVERVNHLNEDVENVVDDLANKDNFSIGEMEFTRHHLSGYCIDVIKIPYENANGTKNIPIIRGAEVRTSMRNLNYNSMAAIGGISFVRDTGEHELCNDILVNDSIISGLPGYYLNSPYLAIHEDGHFETFPLGTDLSLLPANGFHYAAQCRCKFIENGVFVPYEHAPQVVQQNVGVDNANNYYIITTSYYLPLTYETLAAWIIENIPDIKDVYALDGGGATNTTICGIRTDNDASLNIEGRPLTGALVWPLQEDGNVPTLSNAVTLYAQNRKFIPIAVPTSNSLGMEYVSEHVQVGQLMISQINNLVFVHFVLRSHDGLRGGSSEVITIPNLPPATGQFQFYGFSEQGAHGAARLIIETQPDEFTVATEAKFRPNEDPPAGSYLQYTFDLCYTTRSMR